MQPWLEQIVTTFGYFGIALVMFIENIFPPIPSEIIMPFAGFLVANGQLSLLNVLIAGTGGAIAGALAIYYLGVWLDKARTRAWFARYGHAFLLSETDFDSALATFERHGQKMILIGRLIPAIRTLISLPAGLERMTLGKFLLLTALGTTLWNAILAYAGLALGQNWQQVLAFTDRYELAVWIVIAVLVAIFLIKRIRQLSSEETQSKKQVSKWAGDSSTNERMNDRL